MPTTRTPHSIPINAATAYSGGSSASEPEVTPMIASPAAVTITPAHWRRPSRKPKKRSAKTARNTSPPESTACTIESGARASAPT